MLDLENVKERWASIDLGKVNAVPVFARVMEDIEAEFHIHESADELFYVLSGKVFIDTENESIGLNQGESYTVSAGTKHIEREL